MIIADDFGESPQVNNSVILLSSKITLDGVSCFSKPKSSLSIDEVKSGLNELSQSNPKLRIGLHFELKGFTKSFQKQVDEQITAFIENYQREPDYIDSHLHTHGFLGLNNFIEKAFIDTKTLSRKPLLRSSKIFTIKNNVSNRTKVKQVTFALTHYNSLNSDHYLNESIFNLYHLSNHKDFENLWHDYKAIEDIQKRKTLFLIHPSLEGGTWKNKELQILLSEGNGQ